MHDKRVLFCGPINNPLNSGRYMISGIEQLGNEVIGYDYRSSENYEEELIAIAEKENPDYVFVLKGEKLSFELIKKFKELGCITILWFTMIPIEDWMLPLAKTYDYVLTNVEDHVDYFSQRDVKNIRWMHQGFAPDFFGIDDPNLNDDGEYYADVGMIGSMGKAEEGLIYNKRCELVMRLRREHIDTKWWGPRLARQARNIRFFLGGVHKAWSGSQVYMKDFAKVIRHVKIFLGEDADKPFRGRYLSNRSFAVMGCGGFYLCRRNPGVEYAFDIGKECDVYDTNDEMVEKVRYYLEHEEERKAIALKGQEKILNNYSYKDQMEKIFNWVKGNSQETI